MTEPKLLEAIAEKVWMATDYVSGLLLWTSVPWEDKLRYQDAARAVLNLLRTNRRDAISIIRQ